MSPPNSGKSSLLHPIGLMPRRTDMIEPCPAASAGKLSRTRREIATANRECLCFSQKMGGYGDR
jgi:hypothetical protein